MDSFTFNPKNGMFKINGKVLSNLTQTQHNILMLFWGKINVTQMDLIEASYGKNGKMPDSFEVCIRHQLSRINKKLVKTPFSIQCSYNGVRKGIGSGYRIVRRGKLIKVD